MLAFGSVNFGDNGSGGSGRSSISGCGMFGKICRGNGNAKHLAVFRLRACSMFLALQRSANPRKYTNTQAQKTQIPLQTRKHQHTEKRGKDTSGQTETRARACSMMVAGSLVCGQRAQMKAHTQTHTQIRTQIHTHEKTCKRRNTSTQRKREAQRQHAACWRLARWLAVSEPRRGRMLARSNFNECTATQPARQTNSCNTRTHKYAQIEHKNLWEIHRDKPPQMNKRNNKNAMCVIFCAAWFSLQPAATHFLMLPTKTQTRSKHSFSGVGRGSTMLISVPLITWKPLISSAARLTAFPKARLKTR